MLSDSVKAEIARRLVEANSDESEDKKSDLLKRYLGEAYGDEIEGRSQFVDTAAQDAVEAILPEVMDVFTSSPEIVEFEPVGLEDEAAAQQETCAVSHVFWQKNNGFLTLYTWTKEAMIQQNAYVWRGWVDVKRTEVEEYEGLSFEEYDQILAELEGQEYEIESQSGLAIVEDEATGEQVTIPDLEAESEGIDLKIRITKADKEYKIEPFPQEDFFVSSRWNSVSLEGAPCFGRRHRDKTKDDWIAFGFSEDSVELLSNPTDDEEETAARHHTRDVDDTDENEEFLELYEAYFFIDSDEDGSKNLLRVWCTEDGKTIMDWKNGEPAVDEVPSIPISTLTPYIMPHRHTGQSVVEKVDDIARVKTVLMRQTLDALYATLYKRPHYDENEAGEHLEDDLLNPEHGAPVRTGGAEITYPQTGAEGIPMATMPLIEKFEGLQEQRTGATRYNQGLDADTLNKTMGGMAMIMGASQKKAKLVARTFAETGLRDLFLGIHSDLRRGPMKELVIKLKGQWTSINPRTWRHRTDMVVNVGMGKGDRDEKRAALGYTQQVQEKLIAAGSRMVDEAKIYQSTGDFLKTFGVDGVEKYFHDPSRLPPPQPKPEPPDPILISAQAQMQKVQADSQRDAMKIQADERERQRQHEIKMQELRLDEIRLTNSIQNERETLQLKEKEVVLKDDLERDKLSVQGTPGVPYDQVTGDTE